MNVNVDSREVLRSAEWASLRARRDQLLRATDYLQVLDSPLSEPQRAELAGYRQELRALPENTQDPFAVVWPVRPSFLK